MKPARILTLLFLFAAFTAAAQGGRDAIEEQKRVIAALEKGWAKGWKARGRKKADKKPALKTNLWDRLLSLTEVHSIRNQWVKGHAENAYTTRCDELAGAERQKYT